MRLDCPSSTRIKCSVGSKRLKIDCYSHPFSFPSSSQCCLLPVVCYCFIKRKKGMIKMMMMIVEWNFFRCIWEFFTVTFFFFFHSPSLILMCISASSLGGVSIDDLRFSRILPANCLYMHNEIRIVKKKVKEEMPDCQVGKKEGNNKLKGDGVRTGKHIHVEPSHESKMENTKFLEKFSPRGLFCLLCKPQTTFFLRLLSSARL